MTWPTPQEYNEAVQNPRLNFDDADLAAGSPQLTRLGLPRPITGNFASVYRFHCGGRDWAVRCFWRELSDLRDRYAAISAYLKAARLPYTVGFDYVERGIRVRGSWYPVLKMEWVEGQLLSEYVHDHLNDGTKLADLARRWLAMVQALEAAGLAHGDLQHGNVLVVGGDLKLVDYDGMFVPSLAGRASHELGHQNYQHPRRCPRHFGPDLDRFSAWVIYLSLAALSRHPQLWPQVNGGDECLLLRRADFDQPSTSQALQAIASQGDAELRALAVRVTDMLGMEADRLPSLHLPAAPIPAGRSRMPGLPWRAGRRRLSPFTAPAGPARGALTGPPDWVRAALEDLEEAQLHRFGRSSAGPALRYAVLAGAALGALLPDLLGRGDDLPVGLASIASALVLAVLVLVVSFLRHPLARRRREAAAAVRRARRSLSSVHRRMENLRRAESRLDTRHKENLDLLGRKRRAVTERERVWKVAIDAVSRDVESAAARTCAVLAESEERALRQALDQVQQRHVRAVLRSYRLFRAAIPGLGLRFRLTLCLRGVWTAEQVCAGKAAVLERYDRGRIVPIVAWAAAARRSARSSMPRSLPPPMRDAVAAPYRRHRQRMMDARGRALDEERRLLAAVTALFGDRHAALDVAAEVVSSAFQAQRRDIQARRSKLQGEEAELRQRLCRAEQVFRLFRLITFWRYVRKAVSYEPRAMSDHP